MPRQAAVTVLPQAQRAGGDPGARERLVLAHLPLVRALARRFARTGEPLEDLEQVGSVGLLKAIDRYDPGRGDFRAYATPTICGEIAHHVRDRRGSVRVPSRVQELRTRLLRAIDDLGEALGRSPDVDELAAAARVDAETALEALQGDTLAATVPLDDGSSSDELERPEAGYELSEDRSLLAPGLQVLDDRERWIVYRRFFEDRTQAEIATALGVSQVHVSRLLRGAIEKMRKELAM